MTKLQRLYDEQGQSPWLDNLTRPYLRDGTLARMVGDGIRGVTANPTIFARAIEGTDAYDAQFDGLIRTDRSVRDAYWELVIADTIDALAVLRPTFEQSGGVDGFVSLEVAPELAYDATATIAAATQLHERIQRPNLFVKIPATPQGVSAVRTMLAKGKSINVTLLFSLPRYAEILEAHLSGLEELVARGGDPSAVRSVASFFVSRVDTEVDGRLDEVGGAAASGLKGRAAIAQARLAFVAFTESLATERWERLAAMGAHPQRLLWASTSTKDPSYSDTAYVDALIGPDTVTTLAEDTIADFEAHGTLGRTIDAGVDQARDDLSRLAAVGVDLDEVGVALETAGVAKFHDSFAGVLRALAARAEHVD